MLSRVVVALAAFVCCLGFQHDVVPECLPEEEVCFFEFTIDYIETMVEFNEGGRGNPIVYRNHSFFRRTGCETFEPMTSEEVASSLTADGNYRMAFAINGQIPGPSVVVYEGQQVSVNIKNKLLEEGITIHWHGMLQWMTPWMDGVGTVSHCPINPGETFNYRFLADPVGTHWYHSHLGVERTDGLAGALIVLPRDNPLPKSQILPQIPLEKAQKMESNDSTTTEGVKVGEPRYDGDYVVFLQDWFPFLSMEINRELAWGLTSYAYGLNDSKCYTGTQTTDGGAAGFTPFESGTINGRGFVFDDFINPNIPELPLEWFTVRRYQHYRFRVINGGMLYAFRVSVDGHQIQVIGTDGNAVEAEGAESIIIHVGERADIQVYAGEDEGNYWIRAETLEDNAGGQSVIPGKALAVLHYEGFSSTSLPVTERDECTELNKCKVINCPFGEYPKRYNIDCMPISALASTADQITKHPVPPFTTESNFQEIFLNFHFASSAVIPFTTSVNGHNFVPAAEPPQIFPETFNDSIVECSEKDCRDTCQCTFMVPLQLGKTIQVVFLNNDNAPFGMAHPVHMHGHHFHVLKTVHPGYNETTGKIIEEIPDILCDTESCNDPSWKDPSWQNGNIPDLNLENPPMKDTIIIPRKGYIVVRITADNPGYWFVHCHIEMHQISGMALILKEGDIEDMSATPLGFPTCGNFEFPEEEFKEFVSGKGTMRDVQREKNMDNQHWRRPYHHHRPNHGWTPKDTEHKSHHHWHHMRVRAWSIAVVCVLVALNVVLIAAVCILRNKLKAQNDKSDKNQRKRKEINEKLVYDTEVNNLKHKGSSESKQNLLLS